MIISLLPDDTIDAAFKQYRNISHNFKSFFIDNDVVIMHSDFFSHTCYFINDYKIDTIYIISPTYAIKAVIGTVLVAEQPSIFLAKGSDIAS